VDKEIIVMKDKRSLHLKLQELCDCYATSNPLKEMSEITGDMDLEDAALKWLALSILHGINSKAKKISLNKSEDGNLKVSAEYRTAELPAPGFEVGDRVFASVKNLMHMEGDKGKGPLALGIRDGSMEITLKFKKEGNSESATLKFPE
jgi:hypothetical protein